MLVLVIGTSACDKDLEKISNNDVEFCSCLNIEDINKTIPIINEYLEGLPDGISREQELESLVTWLNSFSCNVNAQIIYGVDIIWGQEQISGVSISVTEDKIVRELELDFAVIDNAPTYSQIAGYVYNKQDAIYVKTKYTNIDNVFDFINSLELNVKQIEYGTYLSSMAANADTLQYIINNLKAKPYTTDSWVTGHLHWYDANLVVFLNLYDMKRTDYQSDWVETMNEYKLENYMSGPEHVIVFHIPEGTGEQWVESFTGYDFVHWAELGYTRYTIRVGM